ncbi:hypothetical protein C8J56DRAFT_942120 [Mycena floridula]|nr:hypothetical protein C8J56DRAFT_942120 [Mycena floridula]
MQRIPASTKLLRAAKAGDIAAMKALVHRCEDNKPLFMQFLPIIFQHISQPLGPPNAAILPDFVLDSLAALAVGLNGHFCTERAIIMPTVLENWVSLHRWILFIIETLIEPCPDSFRASDYQVRLCNILVYLLGWFVTKESTEKPPGHMAATMRLWLYGMTYYRELDAVLLDGLHGALTAKQIYKDPEFAHCITTIPTALTTIILTLKSRMPSSKSQIPQSAVTAMSIVTSIYSYWGHEPDLVRLQNGLMAAGAGHGLATFTNEVASLLLSKSGNPPPYHLAMMCALAWDLVLRTMGPTGAVDIFESGGLDAISNLADAMNSASFKPSDIQKNIHNISLLGELLLHPIVLGASRRWLRSVDRDQIFTLASAGEQAHTAWTSFYDQATELLNRRREYKLQHRPICGNGECSVKGSSPNDAKRCGGCLLVHYCSRQCQKEDWKQSHSASCKVPSLRYSLINASALDRDWVSYCLLNGLRALWSEHRYELAPSDRGLYPILVWLNLVVPGQPQMSVQTARQYLNGKTDPTIRKLLVEPDSQDDILFYAAIAGPPDEVFRTFEWSCDIYKVPRRIEGPPAFDEEKSHPDVVK